MNSLKNKTQRINQTNTSWKMCLLSVGLVSGLLACSSGQKDQQVFKNTDKSKVIAIQLERPRQMAEHELQAKASAQFMADHSFSKQRMALGMPYPMPVLAPSSRENYQHYVENGVKLVASEPVSTFSIDVDTGSYTNVRRMLNQGLLPPPDAVRIEEFINYFDYQYPQPTNHDHPFSVNVEVSDLPWAQDRHIMRVALKGAAPDIQGISGRNLVFLLDVSGSMSQPNKLPLLTRSLTLLSQQLSKQDRVSIVVYAGASGVVLEPTAGNQTAKIQQALDSLSAGGSTNGQAGIRLAYQLAEQAFIDDGVNRVILATDGDFNVGVTDHKQLIALIKRQRQKGIALTTLGFGQGNYNDHLMEQLADAGNGNYAYIDTIHEARKVLVDEMHATLLTIAKDVKIQVEFNPDKVSEYRLLGYENRTLNREDFNNDKVDAGEVGAGHTVTAFYEITLNSSANPYLDDLRYQSNSAQAKRQNGNFSDELAMLKLRYKPIDSEVSQLISHPVLTEKIRAFDKQHPDFRFASLVAAYGHLLKQSHFWQELNFQQLVELATNAKGQDKYGYRAEFINLLRTSASLQVTSKAKDISYESENALNTQGFSANIEPKVTILSGR